MGKTKLVATKGLTGITGNIYTGLEDFSDMSFLLHFLQPQDFFADIGANAGSYTVLASGYSEAKTLAFEPVPSTFKWLSKNIELNGIRERVEAFNIGLGSKRGKINFTLNHGTVNHVAADHELTTKENLIIVEIYSFDEIISKYQVPSLIKIDVEGFETEVLAGMSNTLNASELKAVIIELNGSGFRYGFDESFIHNKLTELNFLPYLYNPFRRSFQKLETFGSHNTIYIRDIDFVNERVKNAANIKVFSESF